MALRSVEASVESVRLVLQALVVGLEARSAEVILSEAKDRIAGMRLSPAGKVVCRRRMPSGGGSGSSDSQHPGDTRI